MPTEKKPNSPVFLPVFPTKNEQQQHRHATYSEAIPNPPKTCLSCSKKKKKIHL
jgi:hypothetical protein